MYTDNQMKQLNLDDNTHVGHVATAKHKKTCAAGQVTVGFCFSSARLKKGARDF